MSGAQPASSSPPPHAHAHAHTQYLPAGSGPAPAYLPSASNAPARSAATSPGARCAGLEYANMKKEEAREEYKMRRREELLEAGELARVKRRKKNDKSMDDTAKYHRRLKMNQDSAAAARHAQEAYVSTLEKLVETAEEEKVRLAIESQHLRDERDELATRLNALHSQVASSIPVVADAAEAAVDHPHPAPNAPQPPAGGHGPAPMDPTSSALLLRKMMELFDSPEIPSALTNTADFARGIMGIMPAPAV
jgi:hypothetical protein